MVSCGCIHTYVSSQLAFLHKTPGTTYNWWKIYFNYHSPLILNDIRECLYLFHCIIIEHTSLIKATCTMLHVIVSLHSIRLCTGYLSCNSMAKISLIKAVFTVEGTIIAKTKFSIQSINLASSCM